jgi:hypothetical protein
MRRGRASKQMAGLLSSVMAPCASKCRNKPRKWAILRGVFTSRLGFYSPSRLSKSTQKFGTGEEMSRCVHSSESWSEKSSSRICESFSGVVRVEERKGSSDWS